TAYPTVDTAVAAIKCGARDYLPKPFTPEQVRRVVAQALEERVSPPNGPSAELHTQSPAMRATLSLVAQAAASDTPVLLRGESGTGKGVLAQMLHARSGRAKRPFVRVNCPTLASDLLASELFGHARGALPGALRPEPGRIESAEGGTL